MDTIQTTILFVYNADSSIFSQVSDAVQKIISPSSYECNLCMVTYGTVSMKDEWKKYLDTLPFVKEFLHRDEFQEHYPELANTKLPAIFLVRNNIPSLLISAEDINMQKSVDDLMKLLNDRLN